MRDWELIKHKYVLLGYDYKDIIDYIVVFNADAKIVFRVDGGYNRLNLMDGSVKENRHNILVSKTNEVEIKNIVTVSYRRKEGFGIVGYYREKNRLEYDILLDGRIIEKSDLIKRLTGLEDITGFDLEVSEYKTSSAIVLLVLNVDGTPYNRFILVGDKLIDVNYLQVTVKGERYNSEKIEVYGTGSDWLSIRHDSISGEIKYIEDGFYVEEDKISKGVKVKKLREILKD